MRDGEPNMYTALCTLRNGQTQLQWNRIQMLLVFNTVAIPIAFGSSQPEMTKLILSVVGAAIHFILIVAANRGSGWIDYWDQKLRDLELVDLEESNPNRVRVLIFSHPEFKSFKAKGRHLNKVCEIIGVFFAIFWIEEYIRHLFLIGLST